MCETILLDGDDFQGRKAAVFKEDANDKKNYPKGADWNKNNLDSKSLSTGIAGRKFALDRKGEYNNRVIHWPYLRLAEVYLAYAEALNECGRTSEAYQYINAVRARVGLPGLVLKGKLDEKTEFREAVLRERVCEFVWEENRFFDLIRWKRESDLQNICMELMCIVIKLPKNINLIFRSCRKEYGKSREDFLQMVFECISG